MKRTKEQHGGFFCETNRRHRCEEREFALVPLFSLTLLTPVYFLFVGRSGFRFRISKSNRTAFEAGSSFSSEFSARAWQRRSLVGRTRTGRRTRASRETAHSPRSSGSLSVRFTLFAFLQVSPLELLK